LDLNHAVELNDKGELPTGETDWFYRNLVPKDLVGNLKFREFLLKWADEDPEHRQELWEICSRDILFYLNAFGWTLNPKEHSKHPLRPFITYGYQDKALPQICAAIGNHDLAIPKTRDMGASWLCLIALEHRWHFTDLQLFLLASEKEELVDGPSEKALFNKLKFWWKHLPSWLTPEKHTQKKHALNKENGSSFDGEATVENMATGDRRTAMLLDETSKMTGAAKIFTSTRDVTRSRIFNSTPNGRFGVGEPFYKRVRDGRTKRIFMHWADHPDKSRGLYKLVEGKKVELDPEEYNWEDDYDFQTLQFVGENKPRSPWYDEQCERAQSKTEIAQELDIDFLGSSERFADDEVMLRVRDSFCEEPETRGRLMIDSEDLSPRWTKNRVGEFRIWAALDGGIRPPRGLYSAGVDISAGTGGAYSSQSALVIWNSATKEQVASYATSHVRPEPFAEFVVGACRWFYDAHLVPEINGPLGVTFMNKVKSLGYWNLYVREVKDVIHNEKTRKVGYTNTDKGAEILGRLQEAMSRNNCKVRDQRIVDQFLEYEWKNGRLVHAGSESSESESDKGLTHGDIAIAAACGWLGVMAKPAAVTEIKDPTPQFGTVGYRMQQQEAEELALLNAGNSDFDW
tara:strand:- start:9544 stop:11427 length:1884 start_codon:yes stop_codon:yes gene_type:complete